MKILQTTNFFKPSWEGGGPARVAYGLSKKLVERGHEVTVYTTDGFKSRLKVEKNKSVDVDGIRAYYFRNLSRYLARVMVLPIPYYLPMIARREIKDFDIIHIHEYRTVLGVVAHHYAKKYRIPYVLKADGTLPTAGRMGGLKKIFDLLFGYRILRDADKLIALNEREVEQYKNMGVYEAKIAIVPNGIDMSEYYNLPKRGEFRSKYLIRKDEKIILFLGRIHRIKGIDLLVKAFAELVKELENSRLVIVGPDDGFLSTLKRQIEDLNIGDKILVTGPLYERAKLSAYVDADVYVLPSVYEIFGISILEACACGTPVIVTDRCGIVDVIEGNVGYVVEYDKEKLRKAILKILRDERVRRKFGEAGRKLVMNKFDWSQIIMQIEKVYGGVQLGN